jgi:sortase (surface protein transpeptidase)
VEEGDPLGTIRIPSIDLDWVLFGGVTPATLNQGPGHMPWTPLPGQPGNAVISAIAPPTARRSSISTCSSRAT